MNKIPSGWDYNPSSWPQRVPIVVLAIIGFLVASFWLMLAPLVLHYVTWASALNNLVCSLTLIICAVVPGRKTHRFAGGWPSLFT